MQMLVESISEFSTVPLFRVSAYFEAATVRPRNSSGWHRWHSSSAGIGESEDIVGGKG